MNQYQVMALIGALLLIASGSLQSFFGAIQLPTFSDGYIPYGASAVAITPYSVVSNTGSKDYSNPYWSVHIDSLGAGSAAFDQVGSNDFNLKTGISGSGDGTVFERIVFTSAENVHNKNFRLEGNYALTGNCDNKNTFVGINEELISLPETSGSSFALRWEPHASNPNLATLTINGLVREVSNPSDVRIKLKQGATCLSGETLDGSLNILNPRWQPLFSCTFGQDEMLALETFAAGQQLGIKSFRYEVQKFCRSHQVIITSPAGSAEDTLPYDTWSSGGTLNVPEGQTWTAFYVLKNDGSIPVMCNSTVQAYDVANGRCRDITPGIIQICSQGQYNPELGLCVIQPSSTIICPEGGRYDVSQNVCIYNPEVQYTCSVGTYDSLLMKCLYSPPTATVCPTGSSWNPDSGYCESFPLRQIICDPYYAYDSLLDACVRTPQSSIICRDGGTFDANSGLCIIEPPSATLCPVGYVYDSGLSQCTRTPESGISCPAGEIYDSPSNLCLRTPSSGVQCPVGSSFNSALNQCVYTPGSVVDCADGSSYDVSRQLCIKQVPSTSVCSKGVLSSDGLTCVYTPETLGVCVQGTWNANKNSCDVVPNYRYLCINGEFKVVDGKAACVLTPPSSVVCPGNTVFESGKCLLKPQSLKTPKGLFSNPLTILGLLFLSGALIVFLKRGR